MTALTRVVGAGLLSALLSTGLADAEDLTLIPQAGWTLTFVDSQDPSSVGAYLATNAFDGNPNTMWHTQWFSSQPPPPHEIRINLGSMYNVSAFRYLPRQDGTPNGRIGQFEFYVSLDGVNWGAPVATGTLADLATEQEVGFAPKTGQHIRLRALTEVGGRPYTSMAELNVLTSGNLPANGTIQAPTGNVTIAPGGTVDFNGTGSDPENNLPLTYHWNFGNGSTSTQADPPAVQYVNPGNYTVTFTVTDGLGNPDPVPATRTVTVLSAGTSIVPQAGWTLTFVDSQDTSFGGAFLATNAFDGNPNTMWHTQWNGASPPPPHEIRIDLGSMYNVSAFRYLPRQDGTPNGRIAQYEFYVSLDGVNWGAPVATGTLADLATEQEVGFAPKTGQHIRLRALTEVGGRPYTSMAELNVLTSGNLPANGTIQAPTGNVTIAPGGTVDFNGTGSDPENNLPLTYHWNFGNGSTSTQADPPAVQYVNPGNYTVTFTVTDGLGNPDPVPATRTVTVLSAGTSIVPQAGWTLTFVDSQDTSFGGAFLAPNAFDGNPNTMWHTQWNGASPPPPHEIRINLGSMNNLSAFRYLPRQDGTPNGRIAQYQFYVSLDGVNWGAPVATGTLADLATEQEVGFAPKTGQHIRLRALTEVGGRPYTSMAELNVLTSGNLPPNGTIQAPAGNVTIAPGGTVDFNGTGSDPENNLPLTYHWNFGNGSTSTQADPPAVQYGNPGNYTVTFTVTDGLGNPDPVPATRTVTVQTGVPLFPYDVVPQSNWSLRFVDSQDTSFGSAFLATNAFDGNPNTIWHTEFFAALPPPPHEIQIDLGASHEVIGFNYLPRQDTQFGRIGEYEFYVSTDGTTWGTPVARGAFPDINSELARSVLFASKTGRFIRLRALTEANGDVYSSIAELNVFRRSTTPNQAPGANIGSPGQNLVIPAGGTVSLSGSGSDPDGNLPLSYRWSVTTDSGIDDSIEATGGLVHFNRTGIHLASLTVADALGATGAASRTIDVRPGAIPISHAGWSLRFADSQASGFAAGNAFDGNPGTMWHTQFSGAAPPPPHEIQIDLGVPREMLGFRYLPRQDGSRNGNIGHYLFYVSTDGVNWGTPVVAGTFASTPSVKDVVFPPQTARYVRLRALTEANGLPYTSVAEFDILEKDCTGLIPSVRLLHPRSRYLQSSSTLLVHVDACVDNGQGVRVMIDGGTANGGSQFDLFSPPYTMSVPALSQDEHVVEAFVIDAMGIAVTGDATYDHAARVGVGEYYVAVGDGITYGLGDDIPSDDNSLDGRTKRGSGYPSLLSNLLTAAKGYPVTVANEAIQGTSLADLLPSIPTLIDKHPNAQRFLINSGHNDFLLDNAPSGFGLNPGNPGYAGSFKDRLQQIINLLKAAGKEAVLSKAPPARLLNSAVNSAIQQYNMVVDELAANPNNGITVPPPDFYTYFESRTTTHYAGNFELNGLGYQEMAQLWRDALAP